jgi:hypothetical protein
MSGDDVSEPVGDFTHALLRLIREGFDGIEAKQQVRGDHMDITVDFWDGRIFTIEIRGVQERHLGLPLK